jgi:Rrf2 family transcriptional regulator, iron-sulfur cluster assembly transcription factor
MRVTTKGRYALRALVNLALTDQDSPVPIRQIAEEEEISPEFLEQIFFKLKKAGIIRSVRGPGGGFALNRQLQSISMKDLFLAVGEGLDLTPCDTCSKNDGGECPRKEDCIVFDIWEDATHHISNYFESMNLKQIVTDRQKKSAGSLSSGQDFSI